MTDDGHAAVRIAIASGLARERRPLNLLDATLTMSSTWSSSTAPTCR